MNPRRGSRRWRAERSHVVMTKPGVRANLSVPQHKELSMGTLRALIRHAGLTVEGFLALMES
ncbi:MAG: type II toxin-antitoxin system HicA family toxin [Terriglobia bacterium]